MRIKPIMDFDEWIDNKGVTPDELQDNLEHIQSLYMAYVDTTESENICNRSRRIEMKRMNGTRRFR
jgi:hypothetical protein